jgi:hypothetical protein
MVLLNLFDISYLFTNNEMNSLRNNEFVDKKEFPFEEMEDRSFEAMKYSELDLSKVRDSEKATFLSNGNKHIESLSFHKLLNRYFQHLLNDAVSNKEDLKEDGRIDNVSLEANELRNMSFGQFLSNATDSLFFIFDHKV